MKAFVKSKLGILKKPKYPLNPTENYTLYRLYDNSDTVLLDHVGRHLNQDTKQTTGCFFKYTDLKVLLRDVRDKLEVINPSHFGITDVYRFHLDDEIGFKKDKVTRDICVVTMLGTKDIITMYPQTLSDQFDIEKASTSKELARKRIEGGMKI